MKVRDLDAKVRDHIAALGGAVLNDERLRPEGDVRLRCAADHVWETTVALALEGSSCPRCARYRHDIPAMKALARERGGKCLSTVYRGTLSKLEWRCKRGHEWLATPNTILGGSWCPPCGLGTWTLDDMHAIATERGGRCLSKAYSGKDTKLLWECEHGHRWHGRPAHVKRGAWCPKCAGNAALSIETFREIARARGGECLSKSYVNTRGVLRFRCSEGHTWRTAAANVRSGYWCPHCSGTAKGTLARMREIAKERGGACVSREYVNASTKLHWRCARRHEWEAAPSHVVHGSWCPECAPSRQHTIEEMGELAREYGGRCVSKTYVKSRVPLSWRCAKGHRFAATPMGVLGGRWCLVCKRDAET